MSQMPEKLQQTKINYSPQTEDSSTIPGIVKLHNTNIKERLNLHVKRRLSGNVQMNMDVPKNPLFKPIQTEDTPTLANEIECIKPLQKQQKQRRRYTKRNDKSNLSQANTCTLVVNDGLKSPQNNEINVPITQRYKRTSGGDQADGGEDEIPDVELINRTSDKDKNVDILNLVLSAKKRALLQHRDVQGVLRRIFTICNK